jgi:hypothetical protein
MYGYNYHKDYDNGNDNGNGNEKDNILEVCTLHNNGHRLKINDL